VYIIYLSNGLTFLCEFVSTIIHFKCFNVLSEKIL
jgi:hypothetical protein